MIDDNNNNNYTGNVCCQSAVSIHFNGIEGGNYCHRQYLHTLVYLLCTQSNEKQCLLCIRLSIIQCVQLKSHAIYLIFRWFAQATMGTNCESDDSFRSRSHSCLLSEFIFCFFFWSTSCSDPHYTITIPFRTVHKRTKVYALHPYLAGFFVCNDLL